jgi:hypothetical protein
MDYREYRDGLLTAIENRAKCNAVHFQTQPVRLAIDGKEVWKGKVEVFQLKDHPQAKLAFGWGYQNDQKKIEYITVIGIPPLDNPLSAVKAFVASRKT